jgi:hypothetical protein
VSAAGSLSTTAGNGIQLEGGTGGISITGTISSNAVGVQPGAIFIDINPLQSGTTTLNNGCLITAQSSGSSGNGGQISIQGTTINLPAVGLATVNDSAGSATGNGGSLSLLANGSSFTTGATLSLVSNATGTGSGGSIFITAYHALTIGAGTGLSAKSTSGNGNGGSIQFLGTFPSGSTSTLTVNANIDVSESGTGTGGTVSISNFLSNGTVAINGNINANGGTGGSINIANTGSGSGGNGGVVLAAGVSLTASGTAGAGGSVIINTVGAPGGGQIKFSGAATVSANAGGAGSNNGGSISLQGVTIGLPSPDNVLQSLSANGSGTGNGGSIILSATTGNISGGSGPNGLQFSATGGSSGSLAGNGGSVSVTASAGNLTLPGVLSVNPLGNSGNGGSVTLFSGGTLQVNQGINANAAGGGNGGAVALSYSDAVNSITVGASSANSFVNGNITADAVAAGGVGGTVTINNSAVGPLNVNLAGTISANATASANLGSISFVPANTAQAISVAGAGTLIGTVNATGSTVTINPQAAASTLTAGAISGNAGAVSLIANGTGSQINISVGSTVKTSGSGTDISLQSGTVNNLGALTSHRDLTIMADTLTNSGTMTNVRDLNISTFTAGNPLVINGSYAIALTAGRNVNLGFGNASQITVSGVAINAGTDVSVNGGTNSVTLTPTSIIGTVIGGGGGNLGGSSVSVSVSSGNYSVGALNSSGAITLANTDNTATNGGISVVGAVASTGSSVSLTSGAVGTVSISSANSISTSGGGTDVSLAAHILNNAGSVTSNRDLTVMADTFTNSGTMTTSRDLNLATFTAGNALNITGAYALPLTATRNINLGFGNASQISVSGVAISAGNNVSVNGGTNSVTLTPTSIAGTLIGGGAANLAGSSVNVSVTSGSYSVGTLNSPGAITLANTDNTSGNGNISINGAVASSGSTIAVTSGTSGAITLSSAGSLSTTAGTSINVTGGTGGVSISGTISSNTTNITAGSIAVFSTGVTNLNNGALITAQSSGSAGNGGTITISGSSLTFPGSGIATVNASAASTNGSGGFISLATQGLPGSDITTGSTISLQANGAGSGNGGTIELLASRNLTLSASSVLSAQSIGGNGNGGSITLQANSVGAASGNLTVNTSVNVSESGTGTGGSVFLSDEYGTGSITVNGNLNANGATGGAISIAAGATGGALIGSGVSITANATSGAGGSVALNSYPQILGILGGPMTFAGAATISANAGGAGSNNGGTISVKGVSIVLPNPDNVVQSFSANASGIGNGGSITLEAQTGNILGGAGPNGPQFTANGGSAGSTAGNGGSITVQSQAGKLSLPGVLNVSALGSVGNGGSVTISASGIAQVNQGISANGAGSGNGGTINLTYNDAVNSITVGASSANSFVNGNVTADAVGAGGVGGTVTINNSAVGPLNVNLAGTISANATASANLGSISFVPANTAQAISVAGAGTLIGTVNATGSAVTINPQAAASTLTAGAISGNAGAVSVIANGTGSQINIPVGSTVKTSGSGTDISLQSGTVNNLGAVNSNRDLTIMTDSLTNSGTMTDVRDLDISTFTAGNPLVINGSSGIALTAGRNVNLGFGNASQITVNGVAINAGTDVSVNGGTNSVTLTPTSIIGTVIGGGVGNLGGSSVSVSVSSGNYSVGALNSPGAITLANTDNSAGNGSVSIVGAMTSSASTIGVTSGTQGAISISAAGSLSTTAGNGISLTGGIGGVAISNTLSTNSAGVAAGAITILSTGAISLNSGGLITAQSTGSTGGTVILNNNHSTSAITIDGNILAIGKSGGSVVIESQSGGALSAGIVVGSGVLIEANGTAGSGGAIALETIGGGPVTFNGAANITANAGGAGANSGGSVAIQVASVSLPSPDNVLQTFSANGAGSGNGGLVDFITSAGSISGGTGPNGAQFTATGGSVGSASGNGGTINIQSISGSVTVPGVINVSPLGNAGKGGTVFVEAGSGALQVNQGISANGAGSSNGGTINLTYNDAVNSITVGASSANSFVNGNLTADAVGAGGVGGTVTINNSAVGPLNVNLAGTISANAITAANLGSISFVPVNTAQAISVVGAGTLIGKVNAAGAGVIINPQAAGSTLTVGTISANVGSVTLTTNGAGSQIVIPIASTIKTTPTGTDISLQSATVNNAGTVTSQRDLIVAADTLVNTLSMTNGRDLDISTFTAGNTLNISGAFALPLLAVRNINLGYNNPSAINVSGVALTAGNDVSLNGGNNPVIFAPTSLAGALIGGGAGYLAGSSVSASVSSGNYSVGALNSPGTISLANTDISAGNGNISVIGAVASSGSSVSLTSGALGTISIASGNSITTSATGTDIGLSAHALSNAGTVTSNRDLILMADTFTNTGSMTNARDLDISTFTAGNALNISGTFALPLSAVRNINLGYNNASQITVSGVALNAGNDISVNGGSYSVTLTPTSMVGTLIGGGASNLGGSAVTVTLSTGNLTLGALNSPGAIALTNTDSTLGNGNIQVTGALGSAASSLTMSASSAGSVSIAGGITASAPTVSITTPSLSNNGTIAGGAGGVSVTGNGVDNNLAVTFGAGGAITSTSGAVSFNGGGAVSGSITVTSPSGSSASITTTGGGITFNPASGSSVSFADSGGSATTLNLNGGNVGINSSTTQSNVSASVNNNVTLSFNNPITFTVNSLTNKGTIADSASNVNPATRIMINGNPDLTLAGSGTYNAGGGNFVSNTTLVSVNAGNISITGNPTVASNSLSYPNYFYVDFSLTGSSSISLGANDTLQVSKGGLLYLNTPTLNLGANSQILSSTATSNLSIQPLAAGSLAINLPSGSSATISGTSDALPIYISGLANANTSISSTGLSTLNIRGATISDSIFIYAGGNVTIGSGVNLSFTGHGPEISTLGNITVNGNVSAAEPTGLNLTSYGNVSIATGSSVSDTAQVDVNGLNILNNGTITSSGGNVGFGTQGSSLVVTMGSGAVISAPTGNVGFGAPSSITVGGGVGSIVAGGVTPVITFNGNGISHFAVSVNVASITGSVESSLTGAGAPSTVSITAGSGTLTIGSWNAASAGFFNTGGAVDVNNTISLSGTGTFAATGNIVFQPGSSLATNGNRILLVAGGNIASTGQSSVSVSNLASGTGGTIDLTNASSLSSLASSGNGGNIDLLAYAGSTAGSGQILAPSALTITAGGTGVNNNGYVNALAGGTSGTTVNIGNVDTTGGTGGGGNITIATQSPNITTAYAIANTSITTGAVSGGALQAASLSTGTLTSPGQTITVNSGAGVLTGSITNNGLGANAGGAVNITGSSASAMQVQAGATNGVNGMITASGGSTAGGGGGSITVTNNGTGGINLSNFANISVAAGAGGGAGGAVTLIGGSGGVVLGSGTLDVSASGSGNYQGGNISVTGSNITDASSFTLQANSTGNNLFGGAISLIASNGISLTGATQNLIANGGTTGNGGTLVLEALGATSDVTLGNAGSGLALMATGGSSGSAGGNAGSVTVEAGRNLTVPSGAGINVNALGNNGNGGSISLAAGAEAAGSLQVNQGLMANGVGTGNGGVISVTYNDGSNPIIVGGTGSNSFISGNIVANAAGAGIGGTVTVNNSATGPLNVNLTGTISANATTAANLGSISFVSAPTSQSIAVAGTGTLIGIVNASGASVTINPQAAGTTLTTGAISANTGSVSLSANGSGSQIVIPVSSSVTTLPTGTDITFQSGTVNNLGAVSSNRDLTIMADTLSNLGTTTDVRDLNISTFTAGNSLVINGSTGVALTAGRNVNLGYGSASQINVSGIAINAGNDISVNGGTNSVTLTPISMVGTVIGGGAGGLGGSTVKVSASSGNYSVGALNSPGAITLTNTDNTATNGGISIVGALASTGSSVSLTSGALGTVAVSAAGSVTTGVGATDVSIAGHIFNNAGAISSYRDFTLMADSIANSGAVNDGRDLNVSSFTAGSALTLTGANGLALTSTRNVNLGFGNASQINVSGVAINAGTDVSVNGGANSVTLTPTSIIGTVIGGGAGNLAGGAVSITASSGNYSVGALNSSGAIVLANTDNTATNGGISVVGAIASSGSSVSLTSGALGTISVSSGNSVSTGAGGTDVSLAAHTLTNAGSINSHRDLTLMADSLANTGTMSNGRDLNIASFTAGNALSITGATGLALTATRDINLGFGNASQITVSGVAINAGTDVSFNGGGNSVTLTPTSIVGTVVGGGAGNLGGSVVSVTASSGNYRVGALNSPGAITLANTDNTAGHGNISVVGALSSSGSSVSLTSGAVGTVSISLGNSVSTGAGGTDVSLAGHTVNNAGSINSNRDVFILGDTISSSGAVVTGRDLNVASFTAGNALTINGSTGLGLTAVRDVNLGFGNASAITVSGVALNAGNNISVNGGTNSVAIAATSIAGEVVGGGGAGLAGSSVNVSATTGSYSVGALNSPGAIVLANTDNAAGNGSISVIGALASTGSTVNVTTGALGTASIGAGGSISTSGTGADVSIAGHVLTNAGAISAVRDLTLKGDSLANTGTMSNGRDLNIASFTAGNALTITVANGLTLTAVRNLNLGSGNASVINVSGVAINAGNNISVNGGTHSVTLDPTSMVGNLVGGGAGNLGGNAITVSVSSGNYNVGALNSTGAISLTNTDNTATNGGISEVGALASTGSSVNLTTGALGTVSIAAGSGVSTSGTGTDVSISGHAFTNAGAIAAVRDLTLIADSFANTGTMSNGRDLNIASFTAGNALSITGASGLTLTAVRNVNLGAGNASQINVSGVAINAGANVSVNGGANSVTLDPTSMTGVLIGGGAGNSAGNAVTVNVSSGNYSVGALNSSGTIALTNTDNSAGHGGISVVGALSSTGSSVGLTTGALGTINMSGLGSVTTGAGGTDVSVAGHSVVNAGTINSNRDVYLSGDTIASSGAVVTGRDLNVASFTAGNALTINGSTGLGLTAVRNVNLGFGNASQINVSGVAINAGNDISLNGGANTVLISATSIAGTMVGGGLANLAGRSVNVSATTGSYSVGALNSPGAITLTNTDNAAGHGSISVVGALASAGSTVSVTTGALGTAAIGAGSSVSTTGTGTDVSISGHAFTNAGTITAVRDLTLKGDSFAGTGAMSNGRDLNISSFTAGNALSIAGASGLTLTAVRDINLGSGNASQINVSGVAISAGNNVSINGGTHSVTLDPTSMAGTLIGGGAGNSGGNAVTVSVSSGNYSVGALNSPGAISLVNTDSTATHGGIAVVGAIGSTGGAVSVTAGKLGTVAISGGSGVTTSGGGTDVSIGAHVLTNAGTLSSARDLTLMADSFMNTGTMTNGRDLNVASFTAGNALTLTAANGLTLTAVRNINLGAGNASQISVSGIAINAGNNISVNGGANSVTIDPTSMTGTFIGGGAGNQAGTAVNVSVSSGNYSVGALNATGAVALANTDNSATNGGISVTGALSSTGSSVSLTSGALGTIAISAAGSVTTGVGATDVTLAGHTINNAGTIASARDLSILADNVSTSGTLSSTRDLNISTFTAGNPLVINSSFPIQLTAGRNVNLGVANPSQITVTGVTITANSGLGNVTFDGGTNAVNVSANAINGLIAVTGSSLNMQSQTGNLRFNAAVDTSSGSGSGGAVTVNAIGGAVALANVTTAGVGASNAAGAVSISGATGVSFGAINAVGTGGAAGGSVTVASPLQAISGSYIKTAGVAGGGAVTVSGATMLLSGTDGAGNSINASSTGVAGIGGTVTITATDPPNPFIVGAAPGNNGTAGSIVSNGGSQGGHISLIISDALGVSGGASVLANGASGGRIDLLTDGAVTISGGGAVHASGTTGNGGMIQFASTTPGAAAEVVGNNGSVNASNTGNTSGIVAFNGGATNTVHVSGTGSLFAGDYVGFGDIDPSTLQVISPVVIPTTNSFTFNLTTTAQGGNILNQIQVTGTIPPIPPVPPTPPVPPVPPSPPPVTPSNPGNNGNSSNPSNTFPNTILTNLSSLDDLNVATATIDPSILPTDVNKKQLQPSNVLKTQIEEQTPCGASAQLDPRRNFNGAKAWIVSNTSFQPFYFHNDRKTVVMASPGTTFAADNNYVLDLKDGKLTAITGEQGIVIQTNKGPVNIPAMSTVSVEQNGQNVVRVANLSGGKTNVQPVKAGDNEISANAGQEVVLADASLSDEELIPVDGVQREPVSGGKLVYAGGLQVAKNNFNQSQMAKRESWLFLMPPCVDLPIKSRLGDLKEQMNASVMLKSQTGDEKVKTIGEVSGNVDVKPVTAADKAQRVSLIKGESVSSNSAASETKENDRQAIIAGSKAVKETPSAQLIAKKMLPDSVELDNKSLGQTQALNFTESKNLPEALKAEYNEVKRPLEGHVAREAKSHEKATSDKEKYTNYTNKAIPVSVPMQIAMAPTGQMCHSISQRNAEIRFAPSTDMMVKEDGVVGLSNGELLIFAIAPTRVQAGSHIIEIKAGAVVWITKADEITRICSLAAQGANAVQVMAENNTYPVSYGEELVVGNDKVQQWLKKDTIERRKVRLLEFNDKICITKSEASPYSIFDASDLLCEINDSKNKKDQLIMEKIIKMASCLTIVSSKNGPYSRLDRD